MCLWDWREFAGREALTPQHTALLPGLLHWFSEAAFLYTEYYVSDDKVPPWPVWWPKAYSKPPQPSQSITLAVPTSCHWPHRTSRQCTGSVPFPSLPTHLLKLACCFADWEFPVCKDEQALLERFLLSGYSKKTDSINHQQSNPRSIPVNPDCELQ